MAETRPSTEVARLSDEMNRTVGKLQEVMGQLHGYLREQQYMQKDMEEMRDTVRGINQILREGSPSIVTKVYILETAVAELKASRSYNKDWWFKLILSLSSAAIIALLGLFLTLYLGAKGGGVPKP